MVVDETDGQKKGIAYCGANKLNPAPFQILAQRIGYSFAVRDVAHVFNIVDNALSIG